MKFPLYKVKVIFSSNEGQQGASPDSVQGFSGSFPSSAIQLDFSTPTFLQKRVRPTPMRAPFSMEIFRRKPVSFQIFRPFLQ